jgi:hypothetical protein
MRPELRIRAWRSVAHDLISMDLDFAVDANTGVDSFDVRVADKETQRLRKPFEDAVMRGYKHFGYRRSEIDPLTLTIKE